MGNVKKAAKAAVIRQEIVQMNRAGLSNEAIAVKLGIHPITVCRHLNQFLNSEECRYPTTLTAEVVEVMRAQERDLLEGNQRTILQRIVRLDKMDATEDESETKIADTISRLSDAFNRTSERKCKLLGIDTKSDTEVTHNNLIIVGSHEATILKMLAKKVPEENYVEGQPVLCGETNLEIVPAQCGRESDLEVA